MLIARAKYWVFYITSVASCMMISLQKTFFMWYMDRIWHVCYISLSFSFKWIEDVAIWDWALYMGYCSSSVFILPFWLKSPGGFCQQCCSYYVKEIPSMKLFYFVTIANQCWALMVQSSTKTLLPPAYINNDHKLVLYYISYTMASVFWLILKTTFWSCHF